MKNKLKRILISIMLVFGLFGMTSCNKSDNVKWNITQQADNFDTYQRITVINLRSDAILLQVEGYLSIKDSTEKELAVIIRTGENEYKMHYIYTGSEIVYIVEQLEPSDTDPYHWEIKIFAVIPDIEWGKN